MNLLILSAFPQEQHFYQTQLKLEQGPTIKSINVWVHHQGEHTLFFATTGMGTINAALVVATLAASLKIDYIFFSGTSGGIDPSLAIGDVVVSNNVFDADIFTIHRAVAGTSFESALINPNTKELTPQFYQPCPKLLALAQTFTDHDYKIITGTIASSNHYPSPTYLFELIKKNKAHVIDMESSAIYQFGWLTKTPTLVIRGVSNRLNAQGDDENPDACDVTTSANNAAHVVLQCITHICELERNPISRPNLFDERSSESQLQDNSHSHKSKL